jgi:mannose-6-phosphate isomerase-like protein (cupin superfamily)
MTHIEVVPPGGGEVVGDSADRRVEILSHHDALHVTWSRFGAGRDGADLHVHHRHTDLFYVLLGELTMRLGPGGEEVRVPAGQLVRVPPGVVHGFRNASRAEVRYLNLHAPGVGFADYMRAIRDGRKLDYDQYDPPADGGRPTSEVVIGEPFADTEAIRVEEVPLAAGWREPVDRARLWSYYVLEGELAVRAGERELAAAEGSWVQVPPGRPHSVGPGGAGAARVLEIGATPAPAAAPAAPPPQS